MKLKRCKGCSIAMYCGKDCQKNGWSAHRYAPYDSTVLPRNVNAYHRF